jgi:hypothetical protein
MYPEGEVGPNKSGKTTINRGHQFSFDSISELQTASGVHCSSQFGAHVWRGVAGVVVAASSFSVGLDYLLARVWTI